MMKPFKLMEFKVMQMQTSSSSSSSIIFIFFLLTAMTLKDLTGVSADVSETERMGEIRIIRRKINAKTMTISPSSSSSSSMSETVIIPPSVEESGEESISFGRKLVSKMSKKGSSSSSGRIKFLNDNNNRTNGLEEDETRTKRQLFREDIPHHRPLSGNTYALHHGFPLPGRFSNNPGGSGGGGNTNQLHEEDPPHQNPPPTVIHDHHTIIYDHHPPSSEEGPSPHHHHHHQHQQHHHHHPPLSVEHGNEIVHRYPVEVGQYIQLDHDLKSGPLPQSHDGGGHGHGHYGGPSGVDVGVHPSQLDLAEPQSKPELPADLVVKEPVGHHHHHYGEGGGGGGGGEEGGEEVPIIPYGVGTGPHGGHYYSYAAGGIPSVHYHGHRHPYRGGHPGGPSKFIHLLKTWPLLFTHKMRRTFWPRYRPKIKHHHHYF